MLPENDGQNTQDPEVASEKSKTSKIPRKCHILANLQSGKHDRRSWHSSQRKKRSHNREAEKKT